MYFKQLTMNPHFFSNRLLSIAQRAFACVLSLVLIASPGLVHAQLKIDVSGVGASSIAFASAPFDGNAGLPEDIKVIIENDLARSGFFRTTRIAATNPLNETSSINANEWKPQGLDAMVVGSVRKLADGRLDVRFQLHDLNAQKSFGKLSYTIVPAQMRLTAHKIADYIYEQMLGEKGIFATRIAYVEKTLSRYRLVIADSDGANPQVALASKEPIISPAWSPDGSQLAYVSFETRKPVVFVHALATGKRRAVANFKGSNSAPAWANNGQKLAVVLTKDGGSQIYITGLDGGELRQLTNTGSINTEPVFSADGQSIYFTSDRGGSPQIYRMGSNGGASSRVTFEGNYNISPRISPDGKLLTYVTRREGQFRIGLLDLSSGTEQLLTNTGREESPSFSPNGRFILYATKAAGRGTLALVSKDGRIKATLSNSSAEITEPTWGPFTKD
jgi:TolB protein